MRRSAVVTLAISIVGSLVAATAISDRPTMFGEPIPGLTPSQLSRFADGTSEFTNVETPEDGLGPIFNGRSCGECHSAPAVGGGSERTVTRFGTITNGVFDPMDSLGGSLIQFQSLAGFSVETVPASATITTLRRSTPLFGLGLVDAVPDGTFQLLAAQEAARGDGTAGRVHIMSNGTVGKFGWKAQVPSLFVFAGDAYRNEMGITNPLFPTENCPNGNCTGIDVNALNDGIDGVQHLADFMTMLAPPTRGSITADVEAGEKVFTAIGCDSCHVANLQTGDSELAALRHRPFHPYSDFLLHDMGSLGDGIVQGNATGTEIRTAPLWGLRIVTHLLHDGRATTIDQAILAHEGQGAAARNRFQALDENARTRLLLFLKSL